MSALLVTLHSYLQQEVTGTHIVVSFSIQHCYLEGCHVGVCSHSSTGSGSNHMQDITSSAMLINIVFALQATASHSIVKCYHDLSRRLGVALRHEERRCGYVTEENKLMITAHDEVATRYVV